MTKELWEVPFSQRAIEREVMQSKRKRVTKSQVVEHWKKGGQSNMPKLDTEVREGADDVAEGIVYEIINVEMVDTEVKHYQGIRVSLLSAKAVEGNVMLWQRKVTGTGSKLGVFITALSNDTDKWLHKWLKFVSWSDIKRELEVVAAPDPKAKDLQPARKRTKKS